MNTLSLRIGGFFLLVQTTIRISTAQQVVDSLFTPLQFPSTDYNNPYNWTPSEVPNNTPQKIYNVTTRSQLDVFNIDPTISNLVIDSTSLALLNTSFTVTGSTTIVKGSNQQWIDNIIVSSSQSAGARFVTSTLNTFSGGTLSGHLNIASLAPKSGPAILQFNGADVTTLTGSLSLQGHSANLIDESGNDGLRNLTHIAPDAQLNFYGHQLNLTGPFTNDGHLSVNSTLSEPGLFTIQSNLTNYDPTTHTLSHGQYFLGGDTGTSQPTLFQFPGADIVHNAAIIGLSSSMAKIVDENGDDALRNFSHNTIDGSFATGAFTYSKPGDFTNDGYLVTNGTLNIQGHLTNFDPGTHTLTGGYYGVFQNTNGPSAAIAFSDADIVNNAASINLSAESKILDQNGNNALRNLANNLPGGTLNLNDYFDFIAAGDFANSGEVLIGGFLGVLPHFVIPANHRYVQTEGATHLWAAAIIGDVEINGGSFDTIGFNKSALLDGNLTIGNALFTPRGFTVHGAVQLSANSQFLTSGNSDNGFNVEGTFTAAGTLQIAAPNGQPPSTAVFNVVQAGNIVGVFDNAPWNARIPTVDGQGSFVVTYNLPGIISISGYQSTRTTPHLVNISTRATVGLEDNALVGGFVVTGTQPKNVILRALGPSLAPGIPGTLADPILELHDSSGAVIASNDNWRSDQQKAIMATGIPPANDLESAIVATLPANNSFYTVVVRGADNGTGIGMVEAYDLDQIADSKLANISTRGLVQSGDSSLIGGIVAFTRSSTTIIIRAIGPSLPISGALPDPTLSLFDSNGTLLASNDNWRSDQPGEIFGTGVAPTNDLESAILTTVTAPGGYFTAIVQGKNGETGIALVEVYDLNF
jgi:hypothetical protein